MANDFGCVIRLDASASIDDALLDHLADKWYEVEDELVDVIERFARLAARQGVTLVGYLDGRQVTD